MTQGYEERRDCTSDFNFIEIKQANSHNEKVTKNNKWIVIYSIIEICTMILVFMMQSCYINSMIDKV